MAIFLAVFNKDLIIHTLAGSKNDPIELGGFQKQNNYKLLCHTGNFFLFSFKMVLSSKIRSKYLAYLQGLC